jgi:hypothetical protein
MLLLWRPWQEPVETELFTKSVFKVLFGSLLDLLAKIVGI